MKTTLRLAAAMLAAGSLPAAKITVSGGQAVLESETLERVVRFGSEIRTMSFTLAGRQLLAAPAREFSVSIAREQSNRRPRGLRSGEIEESNDFSSANRARWRGEGFDPSRYDDPRPDAPKWVDTRLVEAGSWRLVAGEASAAVTAPAAGVQRLTISAKLDKDPRLAGVTVELIYEVYDGHPVVRKWAAVRNNGSQWLRLDRMTIDDLHLTPLTRKPLAAAMFGVQPSVVAFDSPGARCGLIAASEVPSALRSISEQGAMGYTNGLFEWVLGPGEEFVSEPVFYYGYSGDARTTLSSVSTPLDRTLEGPYQEFVERHVGVAAATAPMHGPQWMTWAYFYDRIDDRLVRQLADIASRAGFTEMLFDDGWQKGRLGTEVNREKFPDFAATAAYVRSKGMALGLWVSCFRDRDSRDLAEMPEGRILPPLIRSPALPGLGMSFSSPWRDFYVRDLMESARRYGVTYFKQDFSNILYGDLAEGHESRTRRESLLRGLRGLLKAQAELRRLAPEVVNEITHEIYWGTPGVPADLAALKHTARFHIPPNEAIGSDIAREFRGRTPTAEEHAEALRRGCWLARQRFYSHRGLPLYPLEFYAATTASHQGSLTPSIQDRQVASWLMGTLVCFSGDSRTLSEENIAHYRKRLDAVRRLESTYGIYRRFQFSGVPEPTDTDWHWWGKLDARGFGAVVVVRGSGGAAERPVNIPWVRREERYRVTGVFSGKTYGVFTGQVLQDSGIPLALPVYGQELLELAPPAAQPRDAETGSGPDPREIPVPPIRTKLPALPGVNQLPVRKEMPDVMVMNDGSRVTSREQWRKRREEMKRILAYYAVGRIPPPPGNVEGKEVRSEVVLDGTVKYRLVHLTFGPGKQLALNIGVFTPTAGGPFPAIILQAGTPPYADPLPRLPPGPTQGRGLDVLLVVGPGPADSAARSAPPGMGGPPPTAQSMASRQADLFRRGYALVVFNPNDCAEDTTLRNQNGSWAFRTTRFYPAYPGYDWGVLAGWAWGASRVADYLEKDPAIDKTRLIITGASRNGKSAMVAAAFDERLMGAPVVTGGGGVGVYRFAGPRKSETLDVMQKKYPNWFSPHLHEFWGQREKLPFDQHWFLALAAPRPFIALEGETDVISLPEAVRQSIAGAQPAYALFGAKDRLGVNYAKHGHAFTAEDWTAMMDFFDKHLRGKRVDRAFDRFPSEKELDEAAAAERRPSTTR